MASGLNEDGLHYLWVAMTCVFLNGNIQRPKSRNKSKCSRAVIKHLTKRKKPHNIPVR